MNILKIALVVALTTTASAAPVFAELDKSSTKATGGSMSTRGSLGLDKSSPKGAGIRSGN